MFGSESFPPQLRQAGVHMMIEVLANSCYSTAPLMDQLLFTPSISVCVAARHTMDPYVFFVAGLYGAISVCDICVRELWDLEFLSRVKGLGFRTITYQCSSG